MAFKLRKVLISDDISPKCVEILKENNIEAVLKPKMPKEVLLEEINQYDGLIVRSATKVTEEVLVAGSKLKVIGRAGTGVDNIDCDTATKRGILVMNTPTGNSLSAAELTCSMICCLSRQIPQATISMRTGKWERSKFMGNEMAGKTLAIVGLGRIGKEVASRMRAFEMTVIGYDPITPADVAASWGVEWVPLDDIWSRADYITVHTPLMPQTRNLVSSDSLAKCKKGVKIINCARGGIVNEEGLLEALESGQCGGAALDVFEEEPPKKTDLINHPLVISTPHLGASTVEAQERVAVEIANQFVELDAGRSLNGDINGRSLKQALSPETQPWVALATKLGHMMSVVVSSTKKIRVIASGPQFQNVGYLEAAIAAGFFVSTKGELNLINAPKLAKDMAFSVVVTVNTDCGASALTSLILTAGDDSFTLGGAICDGHPVLTVYDNLLLSNPLFMPHGSSLLVYKGGQQNGPAEVISGLPKTGTKLVSYATVDNSAYHLFSLDKRPTDLAGERVIFSF